MMTPADKGLLRHITWQCIPPKTADAFPMMLASLAGGVSVLMPITGPLSYDDFLVLTDRITRFFLVIHGQHLFLLPEGES
jgi:hypothetical protein